MIEVAPGVVIEDTEIEERFVRSPGPGGQNVNKTETAVQLRFDARNCAALSQAVYQRLKRLAGRRMTADGVLVLTAHRFRTQEQNRADARERLAALIRDALVPPKPRKKTRPSKAAKRRRLDAKKQKGAVKKLRGSVRPEE